MTRRFIIFNILLTIIIGSLHINNAIKIEQTTKIISSYMQENNLPWQKAVQALKRQGVDLFLDQEFGTYFGIFFSIISLITLFLALKNGRLKTVVFAAFSCFLTSFVGGLLLLYCITKKELSK